MGEKVYVRRASDGVVNSSEPPIAEAVPLDYGNPRHLHWSTLFRRRVGPVLVMADDCLRRGVERLGGLRQITFALGVTLTCGGIGAGLSPRTDVSFFMALGGLLVGLSIRVPAWRQ